MFRIIRAKSWTDAQKISEKLILWGFRGQENSSWELDTTLHRSANAFKHPFDYLWHREYWMLRQFQRRAHHYCKDLPPFNQKIDWLALMQHYGSPTRLLDFSHSFYVAAFFALENAIKDSAIWAVNLDLLQEKIAQYCSVDTGNENTDITNQRHIGFVNDHISINCTEAKSSNLIVNVEPDRLHERLLIQQGFFLFPCNIEQNFYNNFLNTFELDQNEINESVVLEWDGRDLENLNLDNCSLVKIILPKSIRYSAMENLKKMNISAATLFPGLDGFARSMKYHLSMWPENQYVDG